MSQARHHVPAQSIPWAPKSNVAIFVRTLHLLNLDLDPAWPGITEVVLKASSRNLQQRVKCVEWALYKLFEIYNGEETRNKLRPFFPPLAPLQSLNLRAALLRCLTDLKKDGILPRSIQLRKTMLDECQGERFEELLATFSMIVLRRAIANGQFGDSTIEESKRSDHLVPLIIAHRKNIQRTIATSKDAKEKANVYAQLLTERGEELSERETEMRSTTVTLDVLPEDIELFLRNDWVGNKAWVDEIMRGAPTTIERTEFPDPPNLDDHELYHSLPPVQSIPSLLESVQSTVNAHNERLTQWRAFLDTLPSQDSKPAQTVARSKQVAPKHFTQHQSINLQSATLPQDSHLLEDYVELLKNMKSELEGDTPVSVGRSSGKVSGAQDTMPNDEQDRPSVTGTVAEPVAQKSGHPSSLHKLRQTSPIPQISGTTTQHDKALLPPFASREPQETMGKLATLSLTERARLTLASSRRPRSGTETGTGLAEEPSLLSSSPPKANDSSFLHHHSIQNEETDHETTLDNRTKQSLAQLSSKLQRTRSYMSSSPKRRPKPVSVASSPQLRDITSRLDALAIDEHADYGNVFMSRPKLRYSPPTSPLREDRDITDSDMRDEQ